MKRRSIEVAGLEHGNLPIPVASRIGPFIATGGVRGVDRSTGTIPSNLDGEVRCMFGNARAILEAAGAGCDDILRMTIQIESDDARPFLDQEWVRMFPDKDARPARNVQKSIIGGGKRIQCELLVIASER